MDRRDPPINFWPQIASSVLTFDRTRLEPIAALRCAVGVAIPLATAVSFGQPGAAVFMTVGAVSVGFGSFQGAYRSRARVMLLASIGMTVSIFVGSVTGGTDWLTIAAAATWSFAAGLLAAFGPAGAFVGLQSTVAVLIADAYPSDVRGAAIRAAMVMIGGLIQTFFVVSVWPLRRFHHERRTVGRFYRDLAAYARRVAASTEPVPPEAAESPGTAAVHADPHPFARHGESLVFQALLDEGDRIRASLAALSVASPQRAAPLAQAAAELLDDIASAIEEGRQPDAGANAWERVDAETPELPAAGALRSQLHAAWETTHVPAAADRTARPSRSRRPIVTMRSVDVVATLLANVSLHSAIFRHALRLTTAVTAATAIYRLGDIPRGYWLPMTALLVLKPEFRETFVTGTARILGTLLGGGLATLLTLALGTHHAVLSALLVVFVWLGYSLFRASYTIFTICFTGYVVLLLSLSGLAGPLAAEYRILNTMAGGLLGLLIYAMWPTWESGRAREALATLLDALADDARILLGVFIEPSTWDYARLRASRNRARLARSNAEASIERMIGEPEINRRIEPQLALGLLAAARRYALGALALHAGLTKRPSHPRPEFVPLCRAIVDGLESVSAMLRGMTPAEPVDTRRTDVEAPLPGAEIDLMVDSVNTMRELVAKHG